MALDSRIGTRIKKRRQALRLTQEALAGQLGVAKASVANWESGKHFPLRHLGALESTLGISLDEEGGEVFTDPHEAELWALTTFTEDERRALIARYRESQHHRRRAG